MNWTWILDHWQPIAALLGVFGATGQWLYRSVQKDLRAQIEQLETSLQQSNALNDLQNRTILSDIKELKGNIKELERRKLSADTYRAVQESKHDK